MMKASLSGLILWFSLCGKTLEADTTTAAEKATPTTTKASEYEPQSTNHTAGSSPTGGSQCQSHKLHPENGNQVVMRSWKDKEFDKGKEAVGVVDVSKCKADEVKTPSGCEKAVVSRTRNQLSAPVAESILDNDNTVVHSSLDVRGPLKNNNVDDELKQPKRRKKHRPRKYVFLPGKRIRKGKRCRTNEVQGTKHRCIRRRRPKDSRLITRHNHTKHIVT